MRGRKRPGPPEHVEDDGEYRRLTLDEMDERGCQHLIEGIVERAADDYRNARMRERLTNHKSLVAEECARFFRSAWFEMLTGLDGEVVIEQLEKELTR